MTYIFEKMRFFLTLKKGQQARADGGAKQGGRKNEPADVGGQARQYQQQPTPQILTQR